MYFLERNVSSLVDILARIGNKSNSAQIILMYFHGKKTVKIWLWKKTKTCQNVCTCWFEYCLCIIHVTVVLYSPQNKRLMWKQKKYVGFKNSTKLFLDVGRASLRPPPSRYPHLKPITTYFYIMHPYITFILNFHKKNCNHGNFECVNI